MLKKRTFFWSGGLLCLLILAGWGYYLYNKPHRSAAGITAAASLTADSLYLFYQRDEHAADSQFLGKVIQVKGRITDIAHSGTSVIWILSGPAGSPGGINCRLFTPEKDLTVHPKPGDDVTVKGRCTGFLMDVSLADCEPE